MPPPLPGTASSGWVFRSPDSAMNLALFRIGVAAMVLLSPHTWAAVTWSRLDPALRAPPEGLHWFAAHLPIAEGPAQVMRALLVLGALLALVGLRTRVALGLVAVCGFYVFALPQLTGSVIHDMHLLWFAALLAVSPSGDALSIDARRAGRLRVIPEGPAYAWAIDVACLLFGAIYFFPGFWKLAHGGLDWIFSDNLRNQMYWKWFQTGSLPPFRLDRWPALCRAGALGVVLFELSFPLLVLHRRWRPLAAVGGLAFHLLSQAFLKVPFFGLWGLYWVLVDWRRVAGWAGWSITEEASAARPTRLARVVGVTLLAGALVQGGRGAVQAWPFGCYPTFEQKVGSEIPDVAIEAVHADGRTVTTLLGPRRPEAWALTWRTAGAYGDHPTAASLRAFWRLVRRDPAVAAGTAGAARVRFHRVMRSVIPEERDRPPRRLSTLGELALDPQPNPQP